MDDVNRYPLSWPTGWPRKSRADRARARFRKVTRDYVNTGNGQGYYRSSPGEVPVAVAVSRLHGELKRLGADEGFVLSTNLRTRIDGLPYSNDKPPDDPGAAVYFRLNRKDRSLACDTWNRVADNIAAIAAHIECIRGIDRYGVGTIDQAFAGYAGLPARGETWRSSLGFALDEALTEELITARFRERAATAHPDRGGSHEAMAALNAAKTEALEELRRG